MCDISQPLDHYTLLQRNHHSRRPHMSDTFHPNTQKVPLRPAPPPRKPRPSRWSRRTLLHYHPAQLIYLPLLVRHRNKSSYYLRQPSFPHFARGLNSAGSHTTPQHQLIAFPLASLMQRYTASASSQIEQYSYNYKRAFENGSG